MTVNRKKPAVRTCYLMYIWLITYTQKETTWIWVSYMVWDPNRKSHRAGSMILSQGPSSPIITKHAYLLVYLGPTFYFSYYHSYNGTPVGCSKGKELLIGGDVTIPWVWVPEENKLRWNCQRPSLVNLVLQTVDPQGNLRQLCLLLWDQ